MEKLIQIQNLLAIWEMAGIRTIPFGVSDLRELLSLIGEIEGLENRVSDLNKKLTLSNKKLKQTSGEFARLSMQFVAVKESEIALEKEVIFLKSELNSINPELIEAGGSWVRFLKMPREDDQISGFSTNVELLSHSGNVRKGYFDFSNNSISLYSELNEDFVEEHDVEFSRFQAWRYPQ